MSSVITEVLAVTRAVAIGAIPDATHEATSPRPVVRDQVQQTSATSPAPTERQVNAAVDTLNEHYAITRADLRFRVERDIGMLVVSVVDAKSGKVLMQMPTEDALRAAREVQSGPGDDSLVKTSA